MKVLLATAADERWSRAWRAEVTAIARQDRYGEHELVDDPVDADVILFIDAHQNLPDWRMRRLRQHPYVHTYPDRVFVYDERDRPRDALPGVYVSMPKSRFDQRRHHAAGYIRLPTDTRQERAITPDVLFSFQGRRLPGVREAVLAVKHSRAVLEDTSRHDFFGVRSPHEAARRRYRETMGRSKFILCPRGAGTASFRLFEALAAGRVPVILSDEWESPAGIDWTKCSVRVPETDVASVPDRLGALEGDWEALSAGAAEVYDNWFAQEVWFHRTTERCAEFLRAGVGGLRQEWLALDFWQEAARRLRPSWVGLRRSGATRSNAKGLVERMTVLGASPCRASREAC